MPSIIAPRFLPAILSAWLGLSFFADAQAGSFLGKNGSVILRMCKSADTVKALSVMCRSYLDGYLDAAHYYGKGKATFCLADGDKKKLPGTLVAWIDAHPESLTQPAADVLQQVLTARFPCKGRQ